MGGCGAQNRVRLGCEATAWTWWCGREEVVTEAWVHGAKRGTHGRVGAE